MIRVEQLEDLVTRVWPHAESLGLKPEHVHFELVSPEYIHRLASHNGLPVRYGHWSFGKSQQRLKTAYDFRLTQIYELVVNNVPSYAFVDRTAEPPQALMVVAHVLAHADYFRHHRAFRDLPKDMVTLAAHHRHQMAAWRRQYGDLAVETLIDAGHVLQEFTGESLQHGSLGERSDDVLGFVVRHAPRLEIWERNLLAILWEEARYFWPQQLTKIANEGYATFCHAEILRQMQLSPEEMWETARLNAQIVQVTPPQLNPYRLGYLLFREAFLKGGWDEVFQARHLYDDVGLVRALFHEGLISQAGLAVYRARQAEDPRQISGEEMISQLILDLDHGGLPRITVDAASSRENVLRLEHRYDGRDLDFAQLPFALKLVSERIWGGPVTLLTVRQRVAHQVSHDGREWVDQVV